MIHFCKKCDSLNGMEEDWTGYVCWQCQGLNQVVAGDLIYSGKRMERTRTDLMREEIDRLQERVRQLQQVTNDRN